MERLWALDPGQTLSVREVREGLSDRDLAYTTVMTVLDRLTQKDLATRARDGRAWRYRAVATREQLTAAALRSSLDPLDPGDRRTVLLHFLEDSSSEDLAALREALAEVERRQIS